MPTSTEIDVLQKESTSLIMQVHNFKVKSRADLEVAKALLSKVDQRMEYFEKFMDTKKTHAAWKESVARKKACLDPLESAKKYIKDEIAQSGLEQNFLIPMTTVAVEGVDIMELAKAVIAGKVPTSAIVANEDWILAQAKKQGPLFNLPGVEINHNRVKAWRFVDGNPANRASDE